MFTKSAKCTDSDSKQCIENLQSLLSRFKCKCKGLNTNVHRDSHMEGKVRTKVYKV